MTDPADRDPVLMAVADEAEARLRRVYAISADARQKSMGLSYVTAETRDMALFIARIILSERHRAEEAMRERDETEAVALVAMAIDIAKARVILKAAAQRAQASHGSEDDLSAIYREINVAVRLITPPAFRDQSELPLTPEPTHER